MRRLGGVSRYEAAGGGGGGLRCRQPTPRPSQMRGLPGTPLGPRTGPARGWWRWRFSLRFGSETPGAAAGLLRISVLLSISAPPNRGAAPHRAGGSRLRGEEGRGGGMNRRGGAGSAFGRRRRGLSCVAPPQPLQIGVPLGTLGSLPCPPPSKFGVPLGAFELLPCPPLQPLQIGVPLGTCRLFLSPPFPPSPNWGPILHPWVAPMSSLPPPISKLGSLWAPLGHSHVPPPPNLGPFGHL